MSLNFAYFAWHCPKIGIVLSTNTVFAKCIDIHKYHFNIFFKLYCESQIVKRQKKLGKKSLDIKYSFVLKIILSVNNNIKIISEYFSTKQLIKIISEYCSTKQLTVDNNNFRVLFNKTELEYLQHEFR